MSFFSKVFFQYATFFIVNRPVYFVCPFHIHYLLKDNRSYIWQNKTVRNSFTCYKTSHFSELIPAAHLCTAGIVDYLYRFILLLSLI